MKWLIKIVHRTIPLRRSISSLPAREQGQLHQVLAGRPLVRPRQGERPRRPRAVLGRLFQYTTSLQTKCCRMMIFVQKELLYLVMFRIAISEIYEKVLFWFCYQLNEGANWKTLPRIMNNYDKDFRLFWLLMFKKYMYCKPWYWLNHNKSSMNKWQSGCGVR